MTSKSDWTFHKHRYEDIVTSLVQVCTFHDGCKQGIDQQIFNRKSISRKITHPQSLFKTLHWSYPTLVLRPYIGSQTFLWSLVKVSSKLSSFPCALSAKCAFLGLLRECVRRVYGTPTLLLKYSFAGLLPMFVLESFWRSISTHLTWISCGDWTDRHRHRKTLIFAIHQLVFLLLEIQVELFKDYMSFMSFLHQTCNSGLTDKLYWDFCRSDWQT